MLKPDFNGEYSLGIARNMRCARVIVAGLHEMAVTHHTNRADDTEFSYCIVTRKRPTKEQMAFAAAYISGVNDADRIWS